MQGLHYKNIYSLLDSIAKFLRNRSSKFDKARFGTVRIQVRGNSFIFLRASFVKRHVGSFLTFFRLGILFFGH